MFRSHQQDNKGTHSSDPNGGTDCKPISPIQCEMMRMEPNDLAIPQS
jgi:hypothetical protein